MIWRVCTVYVEAALRPLFQVVCRLAQLFLENHNRRIRLWISCNIWIITNFLNNRYVLAELGKIPYLNISNKTNIVTQFKNNDPVENIQLYHYWPPNLTLKDTPNISKNGFNNKSTKDITYIPGYRYVPTSKIVLQLE